MPRAYSTDLRERALAAEGCSATAARLREALAALVAERNDATLAEYADRLAERTGVRRSASALCRALKALGLVRKKRPSRPPSRTARTWPRRGGCGATGWPGSTPPAACSSTRPASTPG